MTAGTKQRLSAYPAEVALPIRICRIFKRGLFPIVAQERRQEQA
jgi:hypothetical protein